MDATYLAAAGLPLTSIDPASFRMFYMGEEVPIRIEDGGDGRLDGSDAVYFYGRSVDSLYLDGLLPTNKYTAASVFWLSYGGAAGLRMPQRSGVAGARRQPRIRTGSTSSDSSRIVRRNLSCQVQTTGLPTR